MSEPVAQSSNYDVIVVGSGPAGISAAMNVVNRKRTVAVMDGQAPFGRSRKARSIQNYPGFTFASGKELAAAFVLHLEEFEVPLIGEKVSKIIRDEDDFVVFSEREVYHAGRNGVAQGNAIQKHPRPGEWPGLGFELRDYGGPEETAFEHAI